MDRLRLDIAFAARSFARRPGFTALVIATFGLGIGATTAMFSVVDAVLLRALPYPGADRIVAVYPTLPDWRNTSLHAQWERGRFSYPELVEFAAAQQSYEAIGGYTSTRGTLLGAGEPERLQMGIASPGLLSMLGARAPVGRLFDSTETTPVVVLSHDLWRRRFAADRSVIGRTLQLGGDRFEIIGVLPEGFDVVGFDADLWRPAAGFQGARNRDDHGYLALARLRPGVPIERANDEAERLIGAHSLPGHVKHGGRVVARQADLTAAYRLPLILLISAAFILLAAACASVATMLLGSGVDREPEIAIRAALGAPRRRIIAQLLTEGALLGVIGAGAGIGLAALLMRVFLRLAPAQLPRLDTAALDLRVLGFAIAASLVFAVLFTLAPALIISGASLTSSADARRVTRRTRGRLQSGLVVAQVTLATVLLTGAGLLTKTVQRLEAVDPGFDADGLVTVRLSPDYARLFSVSDPRFIDQVRTHFARVVESVATTPGVEVAVAASLPYTGDRASNDIQPEGYAQAAGEEVYADRRFVSANYFDVLRMPLLAGRGFVPADDHPGAPRVVVVNESFARKFWPGADAIGRRIRFWNEEPWTIVGIVRDARERDLRGDGGPTGAQVLKFYAPGRVRSGGDGSLIIRTTAPVDQVAPLIRERIWAVDETIAITGISTMRGLMGDSIAEQRYRMMLMVAFSVLAGVFAIAGVHGVLNRSAARRTREMGVRAALGARSADLAALMLKQGLTLTAIGLGAGLLISWWVTQALESMLFETRPTDPATLVSIVLLLLGLTLIAAWLPARRAATADPAQALRSE